MIFWEQTSDDLNGFDCVLSDEQIEAPILAGSDAKPTCLQDRHQVFYYLLSNRCIILIENSILVMLMLILLSPHRASFVFEA